MHSVSIACLLMYVFLCWLSMSLHAHIWEQNLKCVPCNHPLPSLFCVFHSVHTYFQSLTNFLSLFPFLLSPLFCAVHTLHLPHQTICRSHSAPSALQRRHAPSAHWPANHRRDSVAPTYRGDPQSMQPMQQQQECREER